MQKWMCREKEARSADEEGKRIGGGRLGLKGLIMDAAQEGRDTSEED